MQGFARHLASLKSSSPEVPLVSELSPNRPTISDADIDPAVLSQLLHSYADFRAKYGIPDLNSPAQSVSANARVCLVDGFLMMDDENVLRNLDYVVFLHADYDTLKDRREARFNYVTLEVRLVFKTNHNDSKGVWQDPPNYFTEIVFPAYVQYNSRVLEQLDSSNSSSVVSVVQVSKSSSEMLTVGAINSGNSEIQEMVIEACRLVTDAVKTILNQE
ncbi:ribosylnicotinamide kinase [Entophlyctis luteolus]|nr:ribosylnicotinamide kinase [Entophlyctis luteolus]